MKQGVLGDVLGIVDRVSLVMDGGWLPYTVECQPEPVDRHSSVTVLDPVLVLVSVLVLEYQCCFVD